MNSLQAFWTCALLLLVPTPCGAQPPTSATSKVADWIQQIQQDAAAGRSDAAFAFDPTEDDPRDAATRLVLALDHDSPYVRLQVVVALGELAEIPEVVLPALLGALQDNDQRVRKFALASLIKTGEPAIPYLTSALADLTVIEQNDSGGFDSLVVADYAAFALSRVDAPIISACAEELRAQIEIEKRNRQLPEVISIQNQVNDLKRQLSADNDESSSIDPTRLALANEYASLNKRLVNFLVADTYLRRTAFVIRARQGRDISELLPLFDSDEEAFQRLALQAVGQASELAIPAIEKLLYGPRVSLHEKAVTALQRIGEPAAPAIAKAMLDHPNAEIRRSAARVIPGTETAAPGLIEALLHSEDDGIRLAAAQALLPIFLMTKVKDNDARTPPPFEPQSLEHQAMLALIETLEDDNPQLGIASAQALRSLTQHSPSSFVPFVSKLIDRLKISDGELKAEIAFLLGSIGNEAASAAPILLKDLEAFGESLETTAAWEIAYRRIELIRALGGLGVKTAQVENALLAILRDSERGSEHSAVIESLGRLRTDNAIPAIVQYCTADATPPALQSAVETLLHMEPGIEALTNLLADKSQPSPLRQRLCRALGNSHPVDQRVVSVMLATMSEPDALLQLEAAHALASQGLAEESVVPVLVRWLPYLKRSDGLGQAFNSLKHYPALASAALVAWLEKIADVEPRDRIIASLRELQQSDPRLANATMYLERMASEDIERYADGLRTLAEIGITNDQTTAIAIRGLNHASPDVRRSAVLALRELQPADRQMAVTALRDLLKRETRATSTSLPTTAAPPNKLEPMPQYAFGALLGAIASYGADASDAIPELIEQLSHPSSSIRKDAATALGHLGVDTEEVRAGLIQSTNDPEPFVRESAVEAMLAIGVPPQSLAHNFIESSVLRYLNRDLDSFIGKMMREQFRFSTHTRSAEYVMSPSSLPPLPWPPPRYTHRATFGRDIPRRLLGSDSATLGEIYERLYQSIVSIDDGFECGLFGVGDDGFALLAKLERIDREGAPLPGTKRWVYGELGPLSFKDYLGRLFFEEPGYFRVVAFVITPKKLSGYSNTRLPHISEGSSDLPDHIAKLTFEGCNAYVLIYSFERRRGGRVRIYDELGPRAHLVKSGILASLGGL